MDRAFTNTDLFSLTQQQSQHNHHHQQQRCGNQETIRIAVLVEEVLHGFVPFQFAVEGLDDEDVVAAIKKAGIAVFFED